MKYCISRDQELTPSIIKKLYNRHRTTIAEYNKLADYYCGKTDILKRTVQDTNKPNNKIAHPYAQYITDTLVGYFVGTPITYRSVDEDVHNALIAINNTNQVASRDTELAEDISIFGRAYELHYIDEEGVPRFAQVSPVDMIVLYDDSIESEVLYAIRTILQYDIKTDRKSYKVEVYSENDITIYNADEHLGSLAQQEVIPHYYGMVPVVEYINNKQAIGDFQTVISLIDAYDLLESDALNDFNYFVDAYLMLTGLNADSDDIADMKENRVILLDDANSKAEWLVKSETDTVSENLKNRFKTDIHKFAKVPDLSDEAFSNNASGVAIKYKLFGTESVVSKKERYFRKGLERRIQLLFNILNIKGANYDWRAVTITFTRNLPTNISEIADYISKLSGIVSTESLLAQVPFIEDVKEEMEKLDMQKEEQPFYDLDIESEING